MATPNISDDLDANGIQVWDDDAVLTFGIAGDLRMAADVCR